MLCLAQRSCLSLEVFCGLCCVLTILYVYNSITSETLGLRLLLSTQFNRLVNHSSVTPCRGSRPPLRPARRRARGPCIASPAHSPARRRLRRLRRRLRRRLSLRRRRLRYRLLGSRLRLRSGLGRLGRRSCLALGRVRVGAGARARARDRVPWVGLG